MDETIAAIAGGDVDEALALTPRFASRPSVFVGLLARMMQSRRDALIRFVIDAVESDASLAARAVTISALAPGNWPVTLTASASSQYRRASSLAARAL